MYAVLKQDIISTGNYASLANCGHVYTLGDIVAILAMSDITDAGADLTICTDWEDACITYRVLHMERDPEWEGDDEFPWEPTIATANSVGEAASSEA